VYGSANLKWSGAMKMLLMSRINQSLLKIGIFGGTFDPIHIGHLILMEEARYRLSLDMIYLIPAADPPHKQERDIIPVEHRLNMAQLAIADLDYVWLNRVDIDRPGPHYSVDTVGLIREQVEKDAIAEDVEIYFLVGLDSLRDLPLWSEPERLLQICKLVALQRHDVEIDWDLLSTQLPGVRERVFILDMPELEIASHVIRERVRQGMPIRYQVPQSVEAYLRKYDLYSIQAVEMTGY